MGRKDRNSSVGGGGARLKQHVTADVIVLGCSLPGIVVAHKLRRKFGDSMEIVVLDLAAPKRHNSKYNVAFQGVEEEKPEGAGMPGASPTEPGSPATPGASEASSAATGVSLERQNLVNLAREFQIPLPDAIMSPLRHRDPLNKLFQLGNGRAVPCDRDYHDYAFLSLVERFELSQYQRQLEHSTAQLFCGGRPAALAEDTRTLRYYDRTSMEQHLCGALLFPTTRAIMRLTVQLTCGAAPSTVSVLFYLHQCHRTGGAGNHLGGDNVELREKLLGYCRKRLTHKLQKSVAAITVPAKAIAQIRSYPDERVILETMKGETDYVCNLLAMALRPDELGSIGVDAHLLAPRALEAACAMRPGRARKFLVQYEENFWRREGFSGDILSVRGPILWAMERPKLSSTGSKEKYSGLIGYLRVGEGPAVEEGSRRDVLEQLVKLFGSAAAAPVLYRETELEDVFVPRCGDYVALRALHGARGGRRLEWAALDVFAEGDVAAALVAGHVAYLHVLRALRPQAQAFEDVAGADTRLRRAQLPPCVAHFNYVSGVRLLVLSALLYVGVKLVRSYNK